MIYNTVQTGKTPQNATNRNQPAQKITTPTPTPHGIQKAQKPPKPQKLQPKNYAAQRLNIPKNYSDPKKPASQKISRPKITPPHKKSPKK